MERRARKSPPLFMRYKQKVSMCAGAVIDSSKSATIAFCVPCPSLPLWQQAWQPFFEDAFSSFAYATFDIRYL